MTVNNSILIHKPDEMQDNVTATECRDSAFRQWCTRLHSGFKREGQI